MCPQAPIKPYTTKELLNLYDVSSKVWRSWMRVLKDAYTGFGKLKGRKYNLKQVRMIFDYNGTPEIPEQKKK